MRVKAHIRGHRIWLEPITVGAPSKLCTIGEFLDFLDERPDVQVEPGSTLFPWLSTQLEHADELQQRLSDCDLMPFQHEGVGFLYKKRGAILADEMGLGKTVQALMAIEPEGQAVVVCPAFLVGTWAAECERWRPDLTVHKVEGKLAGWPEPGEVHVVSYARLPDKKMERPWPGTVLIGDEAHYLRNWTKRTKAWRRLARVVQKAGSVWLLSGTPMVENPKDLWAMCMASGLQHLYGDRNNFNRLFHGTRTIHGMIWGTPEPDAMRPLDGFYLRRVRSEVLPQLPPKVYKDIHVDVNLTSRQRLQLDTVYEMSMEDHFNLQSSAVAVARRTLGEHKLRAAADYKKLMREHGRPLLVFTHFREFAERLAEDQHSVFVHGGVPSAKRTEIVREFQAGKWMTLVCTISSMGLGHTITRAADVLFHDRLWTPGENQQAEDRAHRIGQDRVVTIARIIAKHKLDQRMADVLDEKERLTQPMDWPSTPVEAVPTERLRKLLELYQ